MMLAPLLEKRICSVAFLGHYFNKQRIRLMLVTLLFPPSESFSCRHRRPRAFRLTLMMLAVAALFGDRLAPDVEFACNPSHGWKIEDLLMLIKLLQPFSAHPLLLFPEKDLMHDADQGSRFPPENKSSRCCFNSTGLLAVARKVQGDARLRADV